jgi:glutathione S-transferase
MITLYGSSTSPNVLKVRMLLEETGLPYQETWLRRDKGENRTPEFLAISPTGALPAMVDGDTGARVFESSAILLYLADKAGAFLPADAAARGDVFKWLMFEAANVSPAFENIYQLHYLDGDWIAPALELQQQKLGKLVTILNARLEAHDYLAGECSIADFALMPFLNMLEDFLEVPVADYANVARWLVTLNARPGVQRALAAR